MDSSSKPVLKQRKSVPGDVMVLEVQQEKEKPLAGVKTTMGSGPEFVYFMF